MITIERVGRDVTDPVERKKRQNRLRQKAWRERKKAARAPISSAIGLADDLAWKGYGILVAPDQLQDSDTVQDSSVTTTSPRNARDISPCCRIHTSPGDPRSKPSKPKLIPPLLPYASSAPTSPQPSSPPTIRLPLSADHRLITLVQYNVVRAMLFNMSILSMLDRFPTACIRALHIPRFGAVPPEQLPFDLQPTALQRATPHPGWINAIPFPGLRDNLILLAGKYDTDELYYDLGQGLYEGFDDAERRGFLVWGDPWSAHEWEASEGFVRKWGSLLAGCVDVMESTNRWREIRGEERLIPEV